jgi:hypothetical protein
MTKKILEERIPSFQQWFQFDFPLLKYARTFSDLSNTPLDAEVLVDEIASVKDFRTRKVSPK